MAKKDKKVEKRVEEAVRDLKTRFQQHIEDLLETHTFIKATVLPTLIDKHFYSQLDTEDHHKWIQELVTSQRIHEIEYMPNKNSMRLKSLYVHKKVVITESNVEEV